MKLSNNPRHFTAGCLLIALVLGALLPLAFAPYGCWPVALLSPALLYALLKQLTSTRQALLVGWAYGFGLWAVGGFWLYQSIHYYGNVPMPIALIMVGFVATVMGLANGLQCYALFKYIGRINPLSFAAMWLLSEWAKTWIFTGFPWLFVGYAFTDHLLDAYAPIVGVLGLGAISVYLAASAVELYYKQWRWATVAVPLLVLAVTLQPVNWTKPLGKQLSMSLLQGNIPQDLKWLVAYRQQTLDIYTKLSATEWGRDVVLWPESSIPLFDAEVKPFIQQVSNTARTHNSAWVTGIPHVDEHSKQRINGQWLYKFYNSIAVYGEPGSYGMYKKQRLVPFGEYIPLAGALTWVLPALATRPEMQHFSMGAVKQTPLVVKGQPIAAAICYEIAYPNITRLNAQRGYMIITVSNDAWFNASDGPWQHLQMAQMRAIENGKWVARGTNTGVTAVIDHQGRIVTRLPQFERRVLRADVQLRSGLTPYAQLGDTPLIVLAMLLLLLQRKRYKGLTKV